MLFAILAFLTVLGLHAIVTRGASVRAMSPQALLNRTLWQAIRGFFIITTCIGMLFYTGCLLTDASLTSTVLNGAKLTLLSVVQLFGIDVLFVTLFGQALLTMFLIIIAAVYYTYKFMKVELLKFVVYCAVIFMGGMLFIITSNNVIMFIAYELVLLPTILVLDYFSKTVRSRDATKFMILWTQSGALLLFSTLLTVSVLKGDYTIYVILADTSNLFVNFMVALVFFGFSTKMPVWPFYWWLPEAHVEVATNFSIVLSGVSIKFAFLGFIKFISLLSGGTLYWVYVLIGLFGLIDAALKIDTETDIKKIVAYQTVVEMHALVIFVMLDVETFIDPILYLYTAHCWLSTISFILVDIIARRYHTRSVENLYGILAESPRIIKFIFLAVFIFTSIPGTLVFGMEFFIQIFNSTAVLAPVAFIFIQCFVAVWSKNLWWLLWGGDALYHKYTQPFTLTKSEAMFVYILLLQLLPCFIFFETNI